MLFRLCPHKLNGFRVTNCTATRQSTGDRNFLRGTWALPGATVHVSRIAGLNFALIRLFAALPPVAGSVGSATRVLAQTSDPPIVALASGI